MPLTTEQIAIIKSTVPLLESGGEALTKHFYGIMLTEFPEVVPFFNKTHQMTGDQPRALARAVLGYAKHIDHLEAIGPLAGQIIHKHVSINVKAEHYPIVGKCLLRALEEVLGKEIATPLVIATWAAAYQQLADILISAEESLYQTNALKPGGWRNEREFILVHKVQESAEIASFYFRPVDNQPIMDYLPGQYIGLILTINGQILRRNYSLSQLSNGKEYRITVKHESGGIISSYLHETMKIGDTMMFFPPCGDFTLVDRPETTTTTTIESTPSDSSVTATSSSSSSSTPAVFIAGGIGITPMIPMIEKLLKDTNRSIVLIHSTRNSKVQPFKRHFNQLFDSYPGRMTICHFYSQEKPNHHIHLTKEDLVRMIPSSSSPDVYFVGPRPFMKTMKKYLVEDLKIPMDFIHYEFFGPASDI